MASFAWVVTHCPSKFWSEAKPVRPVTAEVAKASIPSIQVTFRPRKAPMMKTARKWANMKRKKSWTPQ